MLTVKTLTDDPIEVTESAKNQEVSKTPEVVAEVQPNEPNDDLNCCLEVFKPLSIYLNDKTRNTLDEDDLVVERFKRLVYLL